MTSATAQSNLKSDLHSAWKQSLNRLTATSQSDSSTPPLQKLVSVGRAWTVVQAHYTTNLQSSDASTVTPTHVVEALNLLSQAGQSTAVSNWYLSYLETQLPERIKILLQPLSTSYQSTSKSNVSSVGVVSQSLVLDLKRYLSPIHQGLFGTSQDQSNLIRIYQTILHSQISKNPSFQTSLLKVLSKSFLTISTSTSDVASIAIDNKGDGDENRELISNLIILGLGSFLKTKFNTISSEKIKFKVIRLVDDGTWKSKQIPSNHQDESEEEEDGIEGEESIGTSSSSLQALKDWLNETLIPSFRNWIDLIDKLEGENRKQNQNLGFQDGDQGGEVEMELEEDRSTNQIESNEATSKDQISKGMEYQMLKILCEVRSHQLFDLVADWPESKPALLDLKECLIHPELKNSVTKTYSQALKIRLLHPGAGTQDIIQIYVHMIRSLREIDPSGVILSLIVPPIRSYLRGRKDTITVIVSGLIGTGESTLLRQELETPVNNNSKGGQSSVGILESEENVSRSAGIKNLEEYDSDYDDDDFENGIKPDWDDENWFPRPIDAGPNYNQSKNEDIINILITIFDDRLGFIKALEQTTAESLIKVRNYDSTREYRNNIILKRRFGSEAIGHCDVMLADITASRRLDSSIRSLYVNEWSHSGPDSPILPSPHPTCLSIKERETFDNLHPLILSKQFWPEFGNSSSSDSSNAYNVNSLAAGHLISGGGDKAEFPKLGSGLDIGSGKGSENLKMPGQFVKALEVYQHYFSRLKDTRKLKWLLNVGKVKLELEMNDGRVLEEEVTPLQAAVIELASEGASESNPLSDQSASQILNVEKAAALNALYFWSSKGILRELQNTPGSFEILEGDGEEGKEKEKEKGKDQDEEMTG